MSVRVETLTKRFGQDREVVGLERVSFTAPDRAITSLLGPSGSGKSTLLRIVAGLEVPDDGKVYIGDDEVTGTPVRSRNVGFVFQNYALFQHMTVFDNVAFGLKVQKRTKSEIEARVSALLGLVQLSGYETRLPDELSGGQRQRVALARALATEPRLLLLDEPFGALDTRVRMELRDWLHQLHEEMKVTTLLVTHDQEEALELSQHVVLLRDGQVEQSGSPMDLYENPGSAFVASFLGGAKVFKGSVQSGRLRLAHETLSLATGYADGVEVEAFVRPHDIRIEKLGPSDRGSGAAEVKRLVRVGSFVKLSVRLPDGDTLLVHLSRRECDERALEEGDRVRLDLGRARITPSPSYVI